MKSKTRYVKPLMNHLFRRRHSIAHLGFGSQLRRFSSKNYNGRGRSSSFDHDSHEEIELPKLVPISKEPDQSKAFDPDPDPDPEPEKNASRTEFGKELYEDLKTSKKNNFAKGTIKAMNLAMYLENQPMTKEHKESLQGALKDGDGLMDALKAEHHHVMGTKGKTPVYSAGKLFHKTLGWYKGWNPKEANL